MFKPLNESKQNLKFQVYPPFIYSDSVQNITLEGSEVPDETSAVVTGWGSTRVRQHILYCVEQQFHSART